MNPNELREKMAALPEPKTDKQPPYWEHWRHQLWQHVVTEQRNPFELLGWPEVYHTMLQNHWLGIPAEEIKALPVHWREQLVAPAGFYPPDYLPGTTYSANLVHQAYNLLIWQQWTGRNLAELETIVEIGGGYGALALVARRLGFTGRYLIYDLPEFLLLQEFFLSNNGVTVEYATFKPDKPNAKKKQRLQSDLLVGCYSLSEMDESVRDAFLAQHPAHSYLFLYSSSFEQYDNAAYFRGRLPQTVFWEFRPAPIPQSFYAIGGVPGPAGYYLPRYVTTSEGGRWHPTTLTCPYCAQPGLYGDSNGDGLCCLQCGLLINGYLIENSATAEDLRRAVGT